MENPPMEKKVSGKLSKTSREFTPSVKLTNKGTEFHPSPETQAPVMDQNAQNYENYQYQEPQHYPPQHQYTEPQPDFDPNYVGDQQNYFQQDPNMPYYDPSQAGYDQQQMDPNMIQPNEGYQEPYYDQNAQNQAEPAFDKQHSTEFQKKTPQGKLIMANF